MKLKLFAAITAFLFLRIAPVNAQVDIDGWVKSGHNSTVEILLEFKLKDGWHIFPPYEQEFGAPLQVEWQLPKNAEILEISYSKPKRFDNEGFIYDAYESKAFYKTTLHLTDVPDYIEGKMRWQACAGDECLPQSRSWRIQPLDSPLFQEKINEAATTFVTTTEKYDNLALLILTAFCAGIILNFMPCVLPVLGLKLMACLHTKVENRRLEAFFYTCGVIGSMLILAVILTWLRKSNPHLNWGFQLQNPWFTGFMLLLFILLTLSAFEIINLNVGFLAKAANLRFKNCRLDAFVSGILAVLIASPCTAPFMGAAIGYAVMAPAQNCFPIFISLGIGYALPFALLTLHPQIMQKVMPRPGKWMKTVKTALGIPLFLTCLWLGWLLSSQLGLKLDEKHLNWQDYSESKVAEALKQKRPVFIDFTADWCLTCLMNKKTSLYSKTMIDLAKTKKILLLRGDITNLNPQAAKGLQKYHRASVPLYIYYDGKSDDYLTLPPILTPQILQDYLR